LTSRRHRRELAPLPVYQENKMKTGTLLLGLLLASVATFAAPPTTEQQLIDLENAWAQAYVTGDTPVLEKLFAEEYLFTDTDGQTFTRDQDIGSTKSGEFKISRFKFDGLKVHVYKDFATVTGLNDFSAVYKGEDASCKCRFTDVFVKRDGRWQAVASHVSKVVEH